MTPPLNYLQPFPNPNNPTSSNSPNLRNSLHCQDHLHHYMCLKSWKKPEEYLHLFEAVCRSLKTKKPEEYLPLYGMVFVLVWYLYLFGWCVSFLEKQHLRFQKAARHSLFARPYFMGCPGGSKDLNALFNLWAGNPHVTVKPVRGWPPQGMEL
jgi:hypothetical protein